MMELLQRPAIVFERVTKTSVPLVLWMVFRRRQVYALSVSSTLGWNGPIRRFLQQGRIKDIGFERHGNYLYEAHALALENVDRLYEHILQDHPIIDRIIRLFGSADIELAFKKELNRRLADFYTINWTINRIAQILGSVSFIYVPLRPHSFFRSLGPGGYHRSLRWIRASGGFCYLVPTARFPVFFRLWDALSPILERASATAKSLGLFLWALAQSVLGRNPRQQQAWAYGINIIEPKRQFANDVQSVGFLADDVLIKSSEMVVVSSKALTSDQKQVLGRQNLARIDNLKNRVTKSSARQALPCSWAVATRSPFMHGMLSHTASELVFYYSKWASFTQQVALRHFVTYCDMDLQMFPRNILLKQAGTKIWYYMDSANFPCYVASTDRPLASMVHQRSCYLFYDFFVSWSDEVSRFFERQAAHIHRYINVGCIWAEHLAQAANGISKELERMIWQRKGPNHRLVAVFDSSYHEDSLTKFADGEAFLTGVLRLVEEIPHACFVLKEKKTRETHALAASYEKLEKHPRCLILPHTQSPSELMAMADLVISIPFTSTTFEALSCRRKAIYFDPTDKFVGTVFDRVPGLVCHGSEQLVARAKELLFETPPEIWDRFVDEQVKGAVESYCDGRALTRFRECLASHDLSPIESEKRYEAATV